MRPSHLHMMVKAPGYRKLVTAFFPEGSQYLESDSVFGVKKSLVVVCVVFFQVPSNRSRSLGQTLKQVDDDEEARRRGFPKGGSFKLLKRDIILLTEEQSRAIRKQAIKESKELYFQD